MINFEKYRYPAIIKQEVDGGFGVYFPTLFSKHGWEISLSNGRTKFEAIKEAKKKLAFSLAGILDDNESLPKPIPIQLESISNGMELIDIETSFHPYCDEIKQHLIGRHWHITFFIEEYEEEIEAIAYKNNQGLWDILFEDYSKTEEELFFDSSIKKHSEKPKSIILFSAELRNEAQEKFNQFIQNVILKYRTKKEWEERRKLRVKMEQNFKQSILQIIDEKVKSGEITEDEALILREINKKS
ncbi:type II toxin-antitoxin system HicB family antitoxin [Gottfriedia luciferensis]|uniref:type II toxin-antitoxin system HicB family antitoxin n=1 Tax=Gottfriedia luciferensis TaxID=178774 RepID=UPI000A043870|nr:type II toxin-antitoxin system HicB family antitoxin [Gottfriedia luciferensis]